MTFLRTAAGIENRGLFLGNSTTVYIEMSADLDPAKALDVAFWREFFDHYYPGQFFSFSPLGGKTHVKNAALRIISDNIQNTLCVMDVDYDRIHANTIDDERVFYTFGYGVENDIFNENSFYKILKSLMPGFDHSKDRASDLWEFVSQTARLDWSCFRSDQIGVYLSYSTLNRDNPSSDIDHSNRSLPVRLRRSSVRKRCRIAKSYRVKPFSSPKPLVNTHHVPAHHFYEIVYHTFFRFISGLTRINMNKNHFMSVGVASIDGLFSRLNGDIKSHYDGIGERIISN